MTFVYFAYGSNMWLPQMRSRCPSAKPLGTAVLHGWSPTYDKPSRDGSAKLNIKPTGGGEVRGVLYRIDGEERPALDAAEDRYDAIWMEATSSPGDTVEALTYRWRGIPSRRLPYDWYVAVVQAGAREHGIPETYYSNHLSAETMADPEVPGVRPDVQDKEQLQQIVATATGARRTSGSGHADRPRPTGAPS